MLLGLDVQPGSGILLQFRMTKPSPTRETDCSVWGVEIIRSKLKILIMNKKLWDECVVEGILR